MSSLSPREYSAEYMSDSLGCGQAFNSCWTIDLMILGKCVLQLKKRVIRNKRNMLYYLATEKIQAAMERNGAFHINTKVLKQSSIRMVANLMTYVKLVKDLHTTKFDQIHAYLEQHELHVNEVRFAVPVFSPEDDPIACLNKAMAFLTAVASSRVTMQKVQGRQGQNYSGTTYKSNATSSRGNTTSGQARVVKCYNCQGEGHMARQCTQPKRPRNAAWYKEKAMLAEAQEAGQILDEEQLTFLIDPGIPAKVPNTETYMNDMDNQSVYALQDFEHSPVMDFIDNEISSDSNIIPYSQYLQETQQETIQDTNLQAQQDSMILSVIEQMEKLALKEQIDSLEQNLSKQIKEKESLFQTFTVFKNEFKEKENKYMEIEIDLEKKIKELDNIIYKVGQSAQTVHMLTKPQAFYDNTHKQALGYQNPFYLKKAKRIKPTLSDGVVMSNTHVAMPVIDDE
ncbi:retrovirus-related pol polyprotein from transposon TNT 1-94 [Tanacetum coccineum]